MILNVQPVLSDMNLMVMVVVWKNVIFHTRKDQPVVKKRIKNAPKMAHRVIQIHASDVRMDILVMAQAALQILVMTSLAHLLQHQV